MQKFHGFSFRVARWKQRLDKKHFACLLEFGQKHLDDSDTIRGTILWSDETNIHRLEPEDLGKDGKNIPWIQQKKL